MDLISNTNIPSARLIYNLIESDVDDVSQSRNKKYYYLVTVPNVSIIETPTLILLLPMVFIRKIIWMLMSLKKILVKLRLSAHSLAMETGY